MRSPVRNYVLTDEQVEVILDRLSQFMDDTDVVAVGVELSRQRDFDPNHLDAHKIQ